MLGISEGPADGCEVSCDNVYAGTENNGCSDCGPGVGKSLLPGETVDIAWDRRVYEAHVADPKCSGHEAGNNCALGVLVKAPSTTGVLTVCADGFEVSGYCSMTENVSISINLADSELIIPVQ
jgi:hypothetical protein